MQRADAMALLRDRACLKDFRAHGFQLVQRLQQQRIGCDVGLQLVSWNLHGHRHVPAQAQLMISGIKSELA